MCANECRRAEMSKADFALSRRALLMGASAAGAFGALGAASLDPALAKAPILNTQAPYFYRFKLGNAEATIVSDGTLPLGDPHTNFLGLTHEEMDKQVTGSVRARASKYNLCSRTCGDVPSRGFQDGQHRHGAAEELESAAIGGNVLVVAGARAEKVAEFIVSPAEPGGRSGAFEAPHGSIAAFDAAVVLLQPVIQVGAGPVPHILAELGADRPGGSCRGHLS